MVLSWLVVLAWIAIAAIAGAAAWFITERATRRLAREATPAAPAPRRGRR